MFSQKTFFFILPILLSSCSYSQKSNANNKNNFEQVSIDKDIEISTQIPVLDVTAQFSKKEIILQDIASLDYIPLETTQEVLLRNNSNSIRFVSDSIIIATNSKTGFCYFFDSTGKVKSYFNHVGESGEEYSNLVDCIVDDTQKEILIYDYGLKY